MIPDKKITIDIKEFFSKGTFGCLTLGKTKEWILKHFPDPDQLASRGNAVFENDLWMYGFIQLHFNQEVLDNIFFDFTYLNEYGDDVLDGGEYLELKKWYLNDVKKLKLHQVVEHIKNAGLYFSKKVEPIEVLNFSADITSHEKIQFIQNGQWDQYKKIERDLVLIEFKSGVTLEFRPRRNKNEKYNDFLEHWKETNHDNFEMWSFSLPRQLRRLDGKIVFL